MNKRIVFIYSIVHFIVDLACAVVIANLITPKIDGKISIFIAIFIYNFFAFAMQLPIGVIADKINKNSLCSAIGCLLVMISFAFINIGTFACLIAGVGNAMFHVGGGIDILNISDRKATLPGIFVSTGAMGIFLGGRMRQIGFLQYYIIVLILIFSAVVLVWLYYQIKEKVTNEVIIIPKIEWTKMIVIICLIITVCIRGYVGLILAFEWKSDFILALISIFAVVFGKILGGVIGDRIGFIKISLISLVISAICFIFAFNNSILGIIAILFFNMTMPITLTALSNMLPNNKGIAFGLTTVALFIGAVPVFLGYTNTFFCELGLFTITIISASILYIGLKEYNKVMVNAE